MKKIFYLSIVSFIIFTSCNFAPGSYPYAEIYQFEVSEDVLINAVENFKKENSKYNLHNRERFKDGRSKNKTDYWYHTWFYYFESNKIVKCWIRGNKIAFIGIGDGFNLDSYKEINKDFSRKENKIQKEKFEKLILDEIKKYIPR